MAFAMGKCESWEKHIYVEGEKIKNSFYFVKFGEKGMFSSSNMGKEDAALLRMVVEHFEILAQTRKVEVDFNGTKEIITGKFFLFYVTDDNEPAVITNLTVNAKKLLNFSIDKLEIACEKEQNIKCNAEICTEIFNKVK